MLKFVFQYAVAFEKKAKRKPNVTFAQILEFSTVTDPFEFLHFSIEKYRYFFLFFFKVKQYISYLLERNFF